MHPIRKYFETFLKLTDEEWNAFSHKIIRQEIQKRTHLVEEGKKCDFIAFIEKGMFRFYYIKDGTECVTAFFFAGDFLSNYRSFLTGLPSDHYIEALEEATVWKLHKKDLNELYDTYPNIDRLGRLVAEKLYLTVSARLDSFLYKAPEERYNDLIKRNSKLLQEVPQYMLASYLGITAESLSRIRKRKN